MVPQKNYLVSFAFHNNNVQFIIPVYQRNYDWLIKHCDTLFYDVLDLVNSPNTHFLGTFVEYQQPGAENNIYKHIIIDGQQRLTTLYLFLKALLTVAEEGNDTTSINMINDLLFNNPDFFDPIDRPKYKLKLKAVKSDETQLENLMDNKFDDIDKSSNIWLNYSALLSNIKNAIQEKNLSVGDFLNALMKLEIIVITLEPNDNPQIVFERINSTGKALDLSDLIRNNLLMAEPNMDDLYNNYWSHMEEMVGKYNLNGYMLSYLYFKLSGSINDSNAYDLFKRWVASSSLSNEEILKDLYKYSKYYALFIGTYKGSYSKAVLEKVRDLCSLKMATIYPFLFSIFEDFDTGVISEKTLIAVLQLLTSYLVRRTIVGIPTNSLRGLFRGLHKRIFSSIEPNDENYLQAITATFASLKKRDGLQTDYKVRDCLLKNDLYNSNKNNFCKFLLVALENGSGNKNEHIVIDETITVEHIMPQNPHENWNSVLNDDPSLLETHLHRLGNLSLTGINNELSNKSFEDKKVYYQGTKFNYLYEDVLDKETWSRNEIEKRGRRLANKLIKLFPLPDGVTDESLERETIVEEAENTSGLSLADEYDYTGAKPTSIEYLGVTYSVSYMIDILIRVCSEIYDDNPEGLIQLTSMADKKTEGFEDYNFISFSPKSLRSPTEIKDSGIYIEKNNNAQAIIKHVKRVLDFFEIDYDELSINL